MSDPLHLTAYCAAVTLVERIHEHTTTLFFNFVKYVEVQVPELFAVEDIDYEEDNPLFALVWEARRTDTQVSCLGILCDNDVAIEITFAVHQLGEREDYVVTSALFDTDSWPNEIEKIRTRVMELIDEQNDA